MTIPTDILMWICGGVLSIIAMLLLTIRWLLGDKWKLVTNELEKSQNYRHHKAPLLFAETHERIANVEKVNTEHHWRLADHDKRLNIVESR